MDDHQGEVGSWVPDVPKFYTEKEVQAEKVEVAIKTRDFTLSVVKGYIDKRVQALAEEGLAADSWEAKAVLLGKIVELKAMKELLERV